jgi:RNA polymerase sigma-70 factor (ECF subfamily)
MRGMSDDPIIQQIRQRNPDALIHLYREYGRLVYSIAYRCLEDAQDAEELTQDVFLRVWDKIGQFDATRGSFTPWLAALTRNAAIDRLRVRRNANTVPISLDEHAHLQETLKADEPDLDLQRGLAAAVEALPAEQRQAIELAYFRGMSQREVAATLHRPLGTVKSHIRQGMERLRQLWKQHEF